MKGGLDGISPGNVGSTYTVPKYEKTWLVYFDILGFRSMVERSARNDFGFFQLKSLYDLAVKEVESAPEKMKGIQAEYHWFSDSFMVWCRSADISCFPWLEFFGRSILLKCVYHRIPVRGALAYGDFYIEPDGRTFFGPALIEAHDWAEAQDWVNFLLCPSVRAKAREEIQWDLGLDYSDGDIPFHENKPEGEPAAYTFRHCANFENPAIASLSSMMKSAPDGAKQKYQNTIDLVQRNHIPMETR